MTLEGVVVIIHWMDHGPLVDVHGWTNERTERTLTPCNGPSLDSAAGTTATRLYDSRTSLVGSTRH